jgi:hypothetical protein
MYSRTSVSWSFELYAHKNKLAHNSKVFDIQGLEAIEEVFNHGGACCGG